MADLSRDIGELHADVRTLVARTASFDSRLMAIEQNLARRDGAERATRRAAEGLRWLASLMAGAAGAEGVLHFFRR
jgi:hypothetical protein